MKPTDELPVIFADRVQSLNYDGPDGSEVFADAGTSIELVTGNITTPGLVVDGTTGDVFVRGDIEATSFVVNDAGGAEAARFFTTAPGSLFALDTGFSFTYPGVEAARSRGVAGEATGALGADNGSGSAAHVAKFVQQVSTYSELTGGDSYQYGTAQVYGYSSIDTGYAEATLNAEAMLGSPAGSGAVGNASLRVIAVPEGYTASSVPYSIEAQGSLRIRQGFNTVLTASTVGLDVAVEPTTASKYARGQVMSAVGGGGPVGTSFTVLVTTFNVTLRAGRLYKITTGFRAVDAVASGVSLNLRCYHNGVLVTYHDYWVSAEGFGYASGCHVTIATGTGVTGPLRLDALMTSGTRTVYSPYIICEDVGPA